MNEHFVIQLLHKHYTGVLDAKDKDRLLDWLKESPDNEQFGDSIKQIWDHSKNYTPSVNFESNTDSAFEKFQSRIRQEANSASTIEEKSPTLTKTTRNTALFRWLISAAIGALLLLTAYLVVSNSTNKSLQYAELSTLESQTEQIVLADKSTVNINEKSLLSYYKSTSGESRNVALEGEAFFDVSKDEKPFVVNTDNVEITVLGTSFNVNASEDLTKVHVKEGKVKMRPVSSNQFIILTANQIGIYDAINKRLYRQQTKSYNGDSWITKGFSFENATLSEVLETLEDYYDIDIYLRNQDIANCVFTSPVYQDVKIEEVLDVLQLIHNFEYSYDEKTNKERIIIDKGFCR